MLQTKCPVGFARNPIEGPLWGRKEGEYSFYYIFKYFIEIAPSIWKFSIHFYLREFFHSYLPKNSFFLSFFVFSTFMDFGILSEFFVHVFLDFILFFFFKFQVLDIFETLTFFDFSNFPFFNFFFHFHWSFSRNSILFPDFRVLKQPQFLSFITKN